MRHLRIIKELKEPGCITDAEIKLCAAKMKQFHYKGGGELNETRLLMTFCQKSKTRRYPYKKWNHPATSNLNKSVKASASWTTFQTNPPLKKITSSVYPLLSTLNFHLSTIHMNSSPLCSFLSALQSSSLHFSPPTLYTSIFFYSLLSTFLFTPSHFFSVRSPFFFLFWRARQVNHSHGSEQKELYRSTTQLKLRSPN